MTCGSDRKRVIRCRLLPVNNLVNRRSVQNQRKHRYKRQPSLKNKVNAFNIKSTRRKKKKFGSKKVVKEPKTKNVLSRVKQNNLRQKQKPSIQTEDTAIYSAKKVRENKSKENLKIKKLKVGSEEKLLTVKGAQIIIAPTLKNSPKKT